MLVLGRTTGVIFKSFDESLDVFQRLTLRPAEKVKVTGNRHIVPRKTRKSPLISVNFCHFRHFRQISANFCQLLSIFVKFVSTPLKFRWKLRKSVWQRKSAWESSSQDPSFLLTCWLTQLSSQDSGSKYRGPEHVWYAEDIKEERSKHRKTENCENICGLEVNLSYISSLNCSTSRGILNVRQEKGLDTEINLMHMNCEGCEWELLEDLLEDPELVKKVVAVFQNFSSLPNV